MAMIQALPEEYMNFMSSVLLLGTLSKSALQDTFYAEETNCRHGTMDSLINEIALLTKMKTSTENTKACRCNPNMACDFCEKLGHSIHDCYMMILVRKQRKERQAAGRTSQTKTNKTQIKPQQVQAKTLNLHPQVIKMANQNMQTKQVQLWIQVHTPWLIMTGMQTQEHQLI